MVCEFQMPLSKGGFISKIIGSLQTVTYSIHNEKMPIRVLGNNNPKGFVFGERTIAGSLIFTVFDKHWLSDMIDEYLEKEEITARPLTDEIPPLNITISMANEYGDKARLTLFNVTFVNEGKVMSINDIYTENTFQYFATDIDYLRPITDKASDHSNKYKYLDDFAEIEETIIETVTDNEVAPKVPGDDKFGKLRVVYKSDDSPNAEVYKEVYVKAGEKVPKHTIADANNKKFVGWQDLAHKKTYPRDMSKFTVKTEMVLTPIWSDKPLEQFKIIFRDLDQKILKEETLDKYDLIEYLDLPPRENKFKLVGWKNVEDGCVYTKGGFARLQATKNMTFEPSWSNTFFTVTFKDSDDKNPAFTPEKIDSLNEGVVVPKPKTIPKKAGFDMVGWQWSDKVYSAVYEQQPSLQQLKVYCDMTIVAVWSKQFKVTYKDGNNQTIFKDVTYTANATMPYPPCQVLKVPENKNFVGWLSSNDKEQKPIRNEVLLAAQPTGDVVLTAVFEDKPQQPANPGTGGGTDQGGQGGGGTTPPPPETVQVTVSPGGSYLDQVIEVAKGTVARIPAFFQKKDGTQSQIKSTPSTRFGYWANDLGQKVKADELKPGADSTIYAVWKKITPRTVRYNDGLGGRYFDEKRSIREGEKVYKCMSFKVPVGHHFKGWRVNYDYSRLFTDAEVLEIIVHDDVYIEAVWDDYGLVVITYTDGCNGNAFKDQRYRIGGGSQVPPFKGDPRIPGFEFKGWVYNNVVMSKRELCQKAAFDNMTIVAKYENVEDKRYTITYSYNGQSKQIFVKHNEYLKAFTPYPAPQYHRFKCWKSNGVEYLNNSETEIPVTQDRYFEAVWEAENASYIAKASDNIIDATINAVKSGATNVVNYVTQKTEARDTTPYTPVRENRANHLLNKDYYDKEIATNNDGNNYIYIEPTHTHPKTLIIRTTGKPANDHVILRSTSNPNVYEYVYIDPTNQHTIYMNETIKNKYMTFTLSGKFLRSDGTYIGYTTQEYKMSDLFQFDSKINEYAKKYSDNSATEPILNGQIIKISLDDLSKYVDAARGKKTDLYLHWSASDYDHVFHDYNLNITGDGSLYITNNTLISLGSHTWRRNKHSIGISISCMEGAEVTTEGIVTEGKYPPTSAQLDMLAKVVAKLCIEIGLKIAVPDVMTHAEVADIDGYGLSSGDGDVRWDLLHEGSLVRKMAESYRQKWGG